MSDTNRVRLSWLEEVTYGVAASGNLEDIRFTGESLKQNTSTIVSAEIRNDRQVADVMRSNIQAAGDINFELSYSWRNWLPFALFSAGWSAPVTVTASTISFASGDNSINDSANGFGSIVAGQWVKVVGAFNNANNGYFKVVSATAAKIVVTGGTLTTESAGISITVTMGEQIVNGVAARSMSIERKYDDLTNTFARYLGAMVNTFSLSFSSEAIITGGFGLIAKQESSHSASFGSGYTSPGSNPVMNAVDNIARVLDNNSSIDITSFSMNVNNTLRGRMQVGTLGLVSIGSGRFDITGTLQAYFENANLITKYLGFTKTSLAFVAQDADGRAFVVEIPAVKFTDGGRSAGGGNADVIADLQWTAYRDPVSGITLRITRFAS